jgi:hypothetical protein
MDDLGFIFACSSSSREEKSDKTNDTEPVIKMFFIPSPASASTMRGILLPASSSSISRSKAATSIFCCEPNSVLHGTGRTQYIGSPS